MTRIVVMLLLAAAFATPALAAPRLSCNTLTIIHPYGPGSTSASVLRLVAEELHVRLKVPVVIYYRPGALGVPSATALLRAAPDGCTLGVLAGIHTSSPWFMKEPPYNPTQGFVPIAHVLQFPNMLVTADVRMRTFGDFLRIARAHPGTVNTGTMSTGSPDYLTGLLLKEAGVLVNLVPYTKEAAQMPLDILNGSLHVGIQNYFAFSGALQQGGLWPLAVTTAQRLKKIPDVPTIRESGLPNFAETKSWNGLVGPPGLPQDMVTLFNGHISEILRMPELVRKLDELGVQGAPGSPAELADLIAAEYRMQGDAVRKAGIALQ